MNPRYKELLDQAKKNYPSLLKDLRNIQKWKLKGFDLRVFEFHREAFQDIDCTQCANCCSTLGPKINQTDISRISDHLGMRGAAFTQTYLQKDEDGDLVFQSMPCPFLGSDLHCSVYKERPRACRDYPHTEEPRIQGRLGKLATNSLYCPAAYLIAQRIVEEFKK